MSILEKFALLKKFILDAFEKEKKYNELATQLEATTQKLTEAGEILTRLSADDEQDKATIAALQAELAKTTQSLAEAREGLAGKEAVEAEIDAFLAELSGPDPVPAVPVEEVPVVE
jgi:DNA repair ATPase RecN